MRCFLVAWLVAGCWTAKSDPVEPTSSTAPPPVKMKPAVEQRSGTSALVVRVLDFSIANNVITVGLNAGQNRGIEASWYAEVLDGQTDLPLPGGELEILTVKPTVTVTRTQLTLQQIQRNTRVRVSPR